VSPSYGPPSTCRLHPCEPDLGQEVTTKMLETKKWDDFKQATKALPYSPRNGKPSRHLQVAANARLWPSHAPIWLIGAM